MSEIASQITSLTIVYSTVHSGADQSKHRSSASLAFVWEIHRWPVNFPHKWPVTRKMFPFDDVIMIIPDPRLGFIAGSVSLCQYQKPSHTWWRHQMETFSASLAICAGNSPVTGEFPAQRPATRSFDVFFDICMNKRLSKQSWGWWFETPLGPLWRHSNAALRAGKCLALGLCPRKQIDTRGPIF